MLNYRQIHVFYSGAAENGIEDIKKHIFFASINWEVIICQNGNLYLNNLVHAVMIQDSQLA